MLPVLSAMGAPPACQMPPKLPVGVELKTPTSDQVDAAAPVLGAGAPYTFAADANGHVTTCRDRMGAVVSLNGCLDAAAYSTAFKFTTDRVIFK